MFSPEKSVREWSIEKLKFICVAQVYLGVGIFVCAVIAVTKQTGYFPFYIFSGFTCGITGALAGIGNILTVFKASSYNGDDVVHLRKELQCTACLQIFFGHMLIFMSFPGFLLNILFLVRNDDDEDNDEHKTHVILSACILSGIVLLLLVTFLPFKTMGIRCQPPGYNQRVYHAYYPNTVGGTQYRQGQSPYAQHEVYTTGGYNTGSNPQLYAPPPPSFGIGQNPTQYGVQPTSVPTAPPPPYSYQP